jgi:hypothetical protein
VKRGKGVDEHDLAFGFPQQRKKFAGNDERSADIDVEQPVKIYRSCAFDFTHVKCTRAVNQIIQPAHCFADKLGEFLDACFVRKVGSGRPLPSRTAWLYLSVSSHSGPQDKLGRLHCEGLRDGLANATAGASYESCLIFYGERYDYPPKDNRFNKPFFSSTRATSRSSSAGNLERSAMSSNEWSPSEKFSSQSMAI